MGYVLDSNTLITIGYLSPITFPTFWADLNWRVNRGKIISVKEVFDELDNHITKDHLLQWIYEHRSVFFAPSSEETEFVGEIFKIPHFQNLVLPKKLLTHNPVADPFVIASAKIRNWTVVTEELYKENAAKIPNVCAHFGVECINLETMMGRENMQY